MPLGIGRGVSSSETLSLKFLGGKNQKSSICDPGSNATLAASVADENSKISHQNTQQECEFFSGVQTVRSLRDLNDADDTNTANDAAELALRPLCRPCVTGSVHFYRSPSANRNSISLNIQIVLIESSKSNTLVNPGQACCRYRPLTAANHMLALSALWPHTLHWTLHRTLQENL